MVTIKGQKYLTIHAEADTVYEIDFVAAPRLDVMNNTTGDVLINTAPLFSDHNAEDSAAQEGTASEDVFGTYVTLPVGTAVNDMAFPFGKVYFKAAAAGDIVIVRCA